MVDWPRNREVVMYDEKVGRLRCEGCGKFMKHQVKGSSWCFVPDSDVSFEENKEYCVACTKKYGPPIPEQSVNIDVCCGIY